MSNRRSGFTMIELLCVIVIVGSLGASAVPNFLNFSKEARAAALRSTLSAMRVGLKNQTQNAILRCGISPATYATSTGIKFYDALGQAALTNNIQGNIGNAIGYTNCFGCTNNGIYDGMCRNVTFPNQAEVKFWDVQASGYAHVYEGMQDDGGVPVPANPFAKPTAYTDKQAICNYYLTDIKTYGSRCNIVQAFIDEGFTCDWLFDTTTGEIGPGTNTSGINECSF